MAEVVGTDEFAAWFDELSKEHQKSVIHIVDLLERFDVQLGFPYSSDLKGTKHAFRELRVKAQGRRFVSPMHLIRSGMPCCCSAATRWATTAFTSG